MLYASHTGSRSQHAPTSHPFQPLPHTQARLAAGMWGGGGFFPLLPWSCIVLESVPEAALAAARSRPPGAGAPPVGGPPPADEARAAKVGPSKETLLAVSRHSLCHCLIECAACAPPV